MQLLQELFCTVRQIKLFIHISYHTWFDEYNYCLSIEDKHTTHSLPLQKYTEIHVHNSYLLNLIAYELDTTSTPLIDTTIITYEIELPPSGKKVDFNLLL